MGSRGRSPPVHGYLSCEKGAFRKCNAPLSFLLVYPNRYAPGMSNLGFQQVYRQVNRRKAWACERAFAHLPSEALALESGRRASSFDVVGFSLSFETDALSVVGFLRSSGIPLEREARREKHPLVMAGGAAPSMNPAPLSRFIDLFAVGEADDLIHEILDVYEGGEWKSRRGLLERLALLEGVYVPGLTGRVKRRLVEDLDRTAAATCILSPYAAFSDMFLVEVSRGCREGCRFCMMGQLCLKPRFRSLDSLLAQIEAAMVDTRRVGLVASTVTGYPEAERLCGTLAERGAELGVSSLRADGVTAGLLDALGRSGMRNVTFAPEVGSDRLRRLIGKACSEDELLHAVELARRAGMKNVKLYFMIGLPTETDGDVDAIPPVVRKVVRILPTRVSVAPFVPKPFTPFQWTAMADHGTIRRRMAFLGTALAALDGVAWSFESARSAMWEGLIARGEEDVGEILERGRFTRKEAAAWALRQRDRDEPFPWEVVDPGVSRERLWKVYERALAAR